ncbi:coiled-coil domain-containing protein 137 isoform X2 [Stegastes partitus]|uniref:Coiled-coil domain-containing protein 137 isoform X2 n=1 Tax=Stegastes partitus TaxID=144197 RepID=A0A9Y4NPN4_9TELE|nr:PREDICTED: coiled-coil domain-containing protein 137 isoform X2 [Stegastes partitus]
MAKNKKNNMNESGKQAGKAGQQPRKLRGEGKNKKAKQEDKTKKAKQEDHLEHIPFKLREIIKSKDRMKTGSKKSKKLKAAILHNSKPEDAQDGDIPVPHFKRKKKESVKAYLQRMNNEAKHVLFLTKNQVDRKPELDADKQEKPAGKGKSDKKKEHDKLRLQKLHQKKLDRQETKMEKEMFVDTVPFGEVSMAPPSFSAKPRKAQLKPQAAKELLLNSLLGHTAASTAKPSMARQRIMEEERLRAVEAYRLLKKQKQQQHEARTANVEKLKNPQ